MNRQERTPVDLIEELDSEAQKFTVVVMVVIFELAKTIFILSDSTNRLTVLTDALALGEYYNPPPAFVPAVECDGPFQFSPRQRAVYQHPEGNS